MSTWRTSSAERGRVESGSVHEIFQRIRETGRQAVLLESGGEHFEAWSFIGVVNPSVKIPEGEEGLIFMREFVRKNYRPKKSGDPPFTAGFVGFLSYDLGEKWMGGLRAHSKLQQKRSNATPHLVRMPQASPEAYFVFVDEVIAVRSSSRKPPLGGVSSATSSSGMTRKEYAQKFQRIKEYLLAGETYQVNFSQRFQSPYESDAFELYQRLTAMNPSPFQFFMETPEFAVISNSPERLLRIRDTGHGMRRIETQPIKGTAPRGKTLQEDEANIARLLASEKENAELTMIVDLERNDLGKICVPGSVEVTEHRAIEKYSHVIHTISNIRGQLQTQHDWYDALRALFPGGSITGCPKKRTMEIIRELEDEPRGIYCGSAGYIDLSGDCDFNIMIRTAWLDKNYESPIITFRSGGGIVADSSSEKEYEETLHKADAMLRSL